MPFLIFLSLSLSRLLLSFLFLLLFKSQLRVTVGVRLDSPPQESRASLHLGISSSQLPFFFPFFPPVLLLLLLLLYVHKLQFHLYFRFFFPKRNPCRLRAEVSGNLYGVEFPLTYIQLLFVPVKVQIDFLFLKRILFFFFLVIFSSQQHQEHLQLRRYGCCQSCKYELLTLSRFRQEKKKNKTKNPKKLKIVLVILYDGGGRYIYYYSTDVCFPIPSRRVHMRG